MSNFVKISIEEFDKLIESQRKLAKANELINEYETKKAQRALSYKKSSNIKPEEKWFGKIIRAANRKLKAQVYQDPLTLSKIILQNIKEDEKHEFFSIFNNRVDAVKGIRSFENFCNENKLDANAVAQHIVIHGNKAMNRVFKEGVQGVYKFDRLKLMNRVIFKDSLLSLEQYAPKEHPDENDEE